MITGVLVLFPGVFQFVRPKGFLRNLPQVKYFKAKAKTNTILLVSFFLIMDKVGPLNVQIAVPTV